MRLSRIAAFVAPIIMLLPRGIAAQSVPAFVVDFTAGTGTHTGATPHGFYETGVTGMLRAAATFRIGGAGRVRPVLSIEHSPGTFGISADWLCIVAPNGGCRIPYNAPDGNAIGAGVAAVAGSRLVGTVVAGVAQYQRRAAYLDANVSLRLFSGVSLVGDARYIRSKDSSGDGTWFTPISVGFRLF